MNPSILLLLACYLSAFAILIHIFKRIQEDLYAGVEQLLIFAIFVYFYYLFESWATIVVPYYMYDPAHFWIMLPQADIGALFTAFNPDPAFGITSCIEETGIPLAVPLMEASLTYTVMWTSKLLNSPRFIRPFFAGAVFLCIDGFMDPVVAQTFVCDGGNSIMVEDGLGVWNWYLAQVLYDYAWFGIPIFNYGAWYSAPVVLIAAANIIGWLRDFYAWYQSGGASALPQPNPTELAYLTIILIAFSILFLLGPHLSQYILWQAIFIISLMIITIVAIVMTWHTTNRSNPWNYFFITPSALFVLAPLILFLIWGFYFSLSLFLLVPLLAIPAVILYVTSPYWH